MSEIPDRFKPPPEPVRDRHEARVERVRDVTRADRTDLPASPNADLGWRQVFPVTYDVVLSPPTDEVETGEDE